MDLDNTVQKPSGQTSKPTKRQLRAEATRRKALSPFRISLMLLALPVTTLLLAANIYIRTSEYDRNGAILHLIALTGCSAPEAIGFGPFRKGYAGYHERYDPDGNGVSCEISGSVQVQSTPAQRSNDAPVRSVGNAKFVRP